jgi:AraC-like DNA-binding protein
MLAAGRPVTHVAYEVGFADQAQLTRHFTKAFGISPARYRMQMNHSARVDR